MNARLLLAFFSLSALLGVLVPGESVNAARALTRLSRDPYANDGAQHRTQVEPDTFAYDNTIVAAFQTGRYYDGGASNIGWATSDDAGANWTFGFLPNTTIAVGGTLARISDPSVAYDVKHETWLILALGIDNAGQNVVVSRSFDGGFNWQDPVTVDDFNFGNDKTWLACDNTATSPYFGNCYASWDNSGGLIHVSVSSDGGATWNTLGIPGARGLGVQPLALPNGTVVIPYTSFYAAMAAVVSNDGGMTWSAPKRITTTRDHYAAANLRTELLPSAEMDGGGKIYLVWQDCGFIKKCRANDLVMTTTTDGINWTEVTRIPLDPKRKRVDHFIPGIAADANTSGANAHLALTYYYYENAACEIETCKLNVGYVSSTNGGATWSIPQRLAGPMRVAWLPKTTLGYMVGDYISTSIVNGKAIPVFAIAREPRTKLREAMFAPANPLPLRGGTRAATTPRLRAKESDRVHPLPLILP